MKGWRGVNGPVQPFTAVRYYSPFYHPLSLPFLLSAYNRNCVSFPSFRWQRYLPSRQRFAVKQSRAAITGFTVGLQFQPEQAKQHSQLYSQARPISRGS